MSRLIEILTTLVAAGGVVWAVWWLLRSSLEPAKMAGRMFASAVVVGLTVAVLRGPSGFGAGGTTDPVLVIAIAAACGFALTVLWGRSLGEALVRPLTTLFDGGGRELERQPLYSMAEAQLKQGHYDQAEVELRKQLAAFPNDLTGTLKLAELQAGPFQNLPQATATVEAFIARPGIPPGDVVAALHRLADWQVRLGSDLESARATLNRIVELSPDTEAGYLARQRAAHLPTPETLQDQRAPHRIEVPKADERMGLRPRGSVKAPAPEDPQVTAGRYVRQLEKCPHDAEARERLALLYAHDLGRLDLAVGQLDQLVAQPHAPVAQVVRWLNALADIQIQCAGDVKAAGAALQRIEDLYPRSAHAALAMRRRMHLPLEMRRRTAARKVGDPTV